MEAVFPIFRAERHNWGLIGPGCWSKVVWVINNDGSYHICTEYVAGEPEATIVDGQLSPRQMKSFMLLIRGRWRDPKFDCSGCDGEAWLMRRYSAGGNLSNSSGKLGYIYGQEKLEAIAAFLLRLEKIDYTSKNW